MGDYSCTFITSEKGETTKLCMKTLRQLRKCIIIILT